MNYPVQRGFVIIYQQTVRVFFWNSFPLNIWHFENPTKYKVLLTGEREISIPSSISVHLLSEQDKQVPLLEYSDPQPITVSLFKPAVPIGPSMTPYPLHYTWP
jgi:hypothetical protein